MVRFKDQLFWALNICYSGWTNKMLFLKPQKAFQFKKMLIHSDDTKKLQTN